MPSSISEGSVVNVLGRVMHGLTIYSSGIYALSGAVEVDPVRALGLVATRLLKIFSRAGVLRSVSPTAPAFFTLHKDELDSFVAAVSLLNHMVESGEALCEVVEGWGLPS